MENQTKPSREYQLRILERQWELLEVSKSYRLKFMLSIITFMLGVTGFILKTPLLMKIEGMWLSGFMVIATCSGLASLYFVISLVRKRYMIIERIYKYMEIDGKEYWGGTEYCPKTDNSKYIDNFFYGVIILLGGVCSALIYLV